MEAPAPGSTATARMVGMVGMVTDTVVTLTGGDTRVEISYARQGRTHLQLRFERDDPQLDVELARLVPADD